MDPVHTFVSLFDVLTHYSPDLARLIHERPYMASLIVFSMFLFITYLLASTLHELFRALLSFSRKKYGAVILGVGAVCLFSVSVYTVRLISISSDPVPIWTDENSTFVGEHIVLAWKFEPESQRPVIFELRSAADKGFGVDSQDEGRTDGYYLSVHRSINGTRYWKLRALEVLEGDKKAKPISSWSETREVAQFESALMRIQKSGVLLVGISNSFNQGALKFETRSGQVAGFDIALIRAIANQLSARWSESLNGKAIRLQFRPYPWQKLLKVPALGEVDLIISSITRRPDREDAYKIAFSRPYLCTRQVVVRRSNFAPPGAIEGFRNRTIGVQSESTSDLLASEISKSVTPVTVKQFAQAEQVVAALAKRNSELDYALMDEPFASGAMMRNFPIVLSELPEAPQFIGWRKEEYAIAVAANETELRVAVNEAMDKLQPGGLRQILDKAYDDWHSELGLHEPKQRISIEGICGDDQDRTATSAP